MAWPDPEDHWSDIPVERLDKWKQWGQKSEEAGGGGDDGGGVYKRRVETYVYQPPPPAPSPAPATNTGFYQPEVAQVQPQGAGNRYPGLYFPRFPAPQPPSPEQRQSGFYPASSPVARTTTSEPPPYYSGFFPSGLVVQYPDTPLLSHPEPVANNVPAQPQPDFLPTYPPHNSGGTELDRNDYQQRQQQYPGSNGFRNYREPIQSKPFIKFNIPPPTDIREKSLKPNEKFSNFGVQNYVDTPIRGKVPLPPSPPSPPPPSGPRAGPYGPQDSPDQMTAPHPGGRHTQPHPHNPFHQNQNFRPPPPPRRFLNNRPRRNFPGPRRPNNNFIYFGPPPSRRQTGGRQFNNRWRPGQRHRFPQDNLEELEPEIEPSPLIEENKEKSDSEEDLEEFYEDDFFRDPDFDNFDFSEFEEFEVYDDEAANDTSSDNNSKRSTDKGAENALIERDYSNNESAETPVEEEKPNMDFNYSREGLEMFKKSHQEDYYENDESDEGSTYSGEDENNQNNVFDSNFVIKDEDAGNVIHRNSNHNQHKHTKNDAPRAFTGDFEMPPELLEYEKSAYGRDPFKQFSYDPSTDDDFAEFDKYFTDFEEHEEHVRYREGRQHPEMRRNPEPETSNKEEIDKLNVITEPFDISDLKSNDKEYDELQIIIKLYLISFMVTVNVKQLGNQQNGNIVFYHFATD